MDLPLPPLKNGTRPARLELAPGDTVVVLGANGAGKTRFSRYLEESAGSKALYLNGLNALYDRSGKEEKAPSALVNRFNPAAISAAQRPDGRPTDLELLLAQLMHDEMVNLISYKLELADGRQTKLKSTRLDRVIELWQEVFPANRVLIDSGKLLFARGLDQAAYSSIRLSDGERAVLYYIGAVLYAPSKAMIFVDSPELFLHPTLTTSLWNRLEALRSDCVFCYTTHDPEFAASRNGARHIWVRDFDMPSQSWDYDLLPTNQGITSEIYLTLAGNRKPVLFIEGEPRSIDARLYTLIFPDYTVQSLGSCNKVIESTRTFNDISNFHQFDSMGIVDRDRRNDEEVNYLRRKRILVPEVAEVENIFLLDDVMRAMAMAQRTDPDRVVERVRRSIIKLFRSEIDSQALMHTRHRMKRTVEYRVDGRFDNIDTLENHIAGLVDELAPRKVFDQFRSRFRQMADSADYEGILRVFNLKTMLTTCGVAQLCGFRTKDAYINAVIRVLRTRGPEAEIIRNAVRHCLKADDI